MLSASGRQAETSLWRTAASSISAAAAAAASHNSATEARVLSRALPRLSRCLPSLRPLENLRQVCCRLRHHHRHVAQPAGPSPEVKCDFICLCCSDRCQSFSVDSRGCQETHAKGHCNLQYADGGDDEDADLEISMIIAPGFVINP